MIENLKLEDLLKKEQELLEKAKEALDNAYNPYSDFSVGAAVLLIKTGEIISAPNIENASFGAVTCAERVAINAAFSSGVKEISTIAVIGRGANYKNTTGITAPCGICRQAIFEFAQVFDVNIEVIMSNTEMTSITIANIYELLPLAFGPKDLGIDIRKYTEKH